MISTYPHMIKPFLFLECVVDIGGDKRVHYVVILAIAIECTIDTFALALGNWFRLGNKLFEEPNRGHDKGCFAVGHVVVGRGIKELVQLVEQPPKRWAVYEHLKDCIGKTHIAGVDETARTNFHGRLARYTGC